jgi:hypothetical protein
VSDDLPSSLKRNASDHASDLLLAITSAVDIAAPGMGSAFGYLVGQVIPNRRQERIVVFLAKTARNLEKLDQRVSTIELMSPEKAALLEDGARDASRSTTAARIEKIADIVAHGISADDAEAGLQRDLLTLFSSLSDSEVATLAGLAGFRSGPSSEGAPISSEQEGVSGLSNRTAARRDFNLVRLVSLGLAERGVSLVPDRHRLGSRARSENPQKLVTEPPRPTAVGRALLAELGFSY